MLFETKGILTIRSNQVFVSREWSQEGTFCLNGQSTWNGNLWTFKSTARKQWNFIIEWNGLCLWRSRSFWIIFLLDRSVWWENQGVANSIIHHVLTSAKYGSNRYIHIFLTMSICLNFYLLFAIKYWFVGVIMEWNYLQRNGLMDRSRKVQRC